MNWSMISRSGMMNWFRGMIGRSMMSFRIRSMAIIFNISDISPIVVGMVVDMLGSAIRKIYGV